MQMRHHHVNITHTGGQIQQPASHIFKYDALSDAELEELAARDPLQAEAINRVLKRRKALKK